MPSRALDQIVHHPLENLLGWNSRIGFTANILTRLTDHSRTRTGLMRSSIIEGINESVTISGLPSSTLEMMKLNKKILLSFD
jgi:hypothetical protein